MSQDHISAKEANEIGTLQSLCTHLPNMRLVLRNGTSSFHMHWCTVAQKMCI